MYTMVSCSNDISYLHWVETYCRVWSFITRNSTFTSSHFPYHQDNNPQITLYFGLFRRSNTFIFHTIFKIKKSQIFFTTITTKTSTDNFSQAIKASVSPAWTLAKPYLPSPKYINNIKLTPCRTSPVVLQLFLEQYTLLWYAIFMSRKSSKIDIMALEISFFYQHQPTIPPYDEK